MQKIIKKYFITILNIFLGLTILPLLFSISVVNIENIYQFNFNNLYSIIYFAYLSLGISFVLFYKYINIKNNAIKEELNYTLKSIFFISLLIIPSFFINHTFIIEHITESNLYLRSYGKIAFLYFALSLSISPIVGFVKKSKYRENLLLSRKIFGILAFIFFLKHSLEYFSLEYIFQSKYNNDISYFEYVYKNMIVRYDALSGFIAGLLMLILGITSNKFSIKLFSGKKWKLLQSFVYPAFLISIIHIAFASRFDNFYIFLMLFVVILRTTAYTAHKKEKKEGKTTKYICIPCGYIYDENKGDPDSGIGPGTKFEDIPDNWYCPVCGVTKSDFEPYYESNETIFGGYLGEVIIYNMLTEDVLEISIKLNTNIEVSRGQYAIITLKDFDGEFSRAYSIVASKNNILTFGIKIKDIGRGGRKLKNIKIGDILKIKGIYGEFTLKDTNKPKVFIASGTGLSPIINMINGELNNKNNHLFFSVQYEKDLFYIDEINKIKNLKKHIFLSREEIKGFNHGRIDLKSIKFDKKTEFYICGNPGLVVETKKYLEHSGYENIYIEKFN